MTTRVVFNQKGGVGKTTVLANLAAIAADRGKRTLVIDLDAQCNASQYLLSSDGRQAECGSADFFEATLERGRRGDDLADYVTETPFDNLSIIAAHPDLESIRVKLEAKHKIYKLRQGLEKLDDYDEIFIDTPPALNFYSQSALIAADRVLVPFDCDDFARQALYALFDNIHEIQEDHNPALAVDGIVVNQFQPRAKLPQRMLAELTEEGHPIIDAHVTSSVKVRESHDASIPLIHYAPGHKVTQQLVALYDKL
ncbi:ParA family protein [Salinisphaera hydrothermalis]|uniref:Cobyrinic acid a,c-diamide synthase n=1 Tax=Salinisphaera hydrothermalis (strain C41B8) TaxID=1304275 RepID=A0A084IQD3_SALHC|nr:ParA family protein [Salinisphaera hydrothermalis]KEZ78917.1 cobyrinic acid a,c-diamide synthase [Salinisphaera hydrothermalis C41B8]